MSMTTVTEADRPRRRGARGRWCRGTRRSGSPALLNLLRPRSPSAAADYDRVGCLRGVNDVARHHNALLRAAVGRLRAKHPRAIIIFADFYAPIRRRILENPSQFGVVSDVLRACCRTGGGAYNWNASAVCGMSGVAACANPSAYMNWDGVHFTEAVNRYVAEGWLYGPYADPPILKSHAALAAVHSS